MVEYAQGVPPKILRGGYAPYTPTADFYKIPSPSGSSFYKNQFHQKRGNRMIKELYKKNPEYYSYMYLDGYTPEQILYARRKKMLEEREDRNIEIKLSSQQEKTLENTINRALDDIFKGWK